MAETSVGIRDLKARLSSYLRRVKSGGTIVVTEYGRPIARIIPEGQGMAAQLQELIVAGIIDWSGRPLQPRAPVARARGTTAVADLLLENRE